MSKSALVVIDVQKDYFPGGRFPLHNIDAAADNVARLIAAARASGEPVIHIRHEFASKDAPFFTPGSDGAQIHPKVAAQSGEAVIVKHQINSFLETNLKETIDATGAKHLVLCGAMSHMCVDAGARAAADLGYNVTVVHDACASRDLEFNGVKIPAELAHAAYMSSLKFGYGQMMSTDELLASKQDAK